MNTTPKDALTEARRLVDRVRGDSWGDIAQAEGLHRIADAVEELVAIVRAALVVVPEPEPKRRVFESFDDAYAWLHGEAARP